MPDARKLSVLTGSGCLRRLVTLAHGVYYDCHQQLTSCCIHRPRCGCRHWYDTTNPRSPSPAELPRPPCQKADERHTTTLLQPTTHPHATYGTTFTPADAQLTAARPLHPAFSYAAEGCEDSKPSVLASGTRKRHASPSQCATLKVQAPSATADRSANRKHRRRTSRSPIAKASSAGLKPAGARVPAPKEAGDPPRTSHLAHADLLTRKRHGALPSKPRLGRARPRRSGSCCPKELCASDQPDLPPACSSARGSREACECRAAIAPLQPASTRRRVLSRTTRTRAQLVTFRDADIHTSAHGGPAVRGLRAFSAVHTSWQRRPRF